MHHSTEALIARIALSLYISGRKVERVPKVTEIQPWERAEFVVAPRRLAGDAYFANVINRDVYEGI
jgi:hypothetical protein